MLKNLLQAVFPDEIIERTGLGKEQIANKIDFFDGNELNLENYDLAIIGLEEDRECKEKGSCAFAPQAVRKELYQLYNWLPEMRMVDLGNVKKGQKIEGSYTNLAQTVQVLLQNNIIPIIIGGTQDFSYGQFLAYENLNHKINVGVLDEKIDVLNLENTPPSEGFINNILLHQPNFINHYIQMGYQHYLTDHNILDTLDELHYERYRLAYFKQNIQRAEPLMRDLDMLSFDISCIKYTDAPGQKNGSPHGFYGEEACLLMRYAGASNRLRSMGIYNYIPKNDTNNLTANLVAQLIWHFIEGFYNRKMEFPGIYDEEFTQYTVNMEDDEQDIIFLKSRLTNRWWVKIPVENKNGEKTNKIIPCLYEDYEIATQNEIPNRWFQALLRFTSKEN